MPPSSISRQLYTQAHVDENGVTYLADRVPFGYVELADTIKHRVRFGDSLWTLAARYYSGMPRPAGFWWVIADFQPVPIVDPTIALAEGTTVLVPSVRALRELVLDNGRSRVSSD